MSMWERCITRGGMPGEIFPTVYNATTRIVQGPGYVAFTYEMIHDTRVIPTNGRPRLGGAVHQYFGDSRGRWEGDTLVVEVTNFTSKALVQRLERGTASRRTLQPPRRQCRPLHSHR
jgi:hypothetical protein